jgi:hypothetical protein
MLCVSARAVFRLACNQATLHLIRARGEMCCEYDPSMVTLRKCRSIFVALGICRAMQKLLDNCAFLRVDFDGLSGGSPKAVQSKGRKNATAFLHRGDDDACGGTTTT